MGKFSLQVLSGVNCGWEVVREGELLPGELVIVSVWVEFVVGRGKRLDEEVGGTRSLAVDRRRHILCLTLRQACTLDWLFIFHTTRYTDF